jgi:hypothetical protein
MVYGEPPEVSGYVDWLLSSSIGGDFYMGISDFPPKAQPTDVLFTREGEQHLVVIDGELTPQLEDEEITLRAGDSYSIPGTLPHHVFNRGDALARAIWVNAPVILPADGPSRGNLHPCPARGAGHVTRAGARPAPHPSGRVPRHASKSGARPLIAQPTGVMT